MSEPQRNWNFREVLLAPVSQHVLELSLRMHPQALHLVRVNRSVGRVNEVERVAHSEPSVRPSEVRQDPPLNQR